MTPRVWRALVNCINLELQIKEIGVIPTLTHYSEIVSDIPSGRIYWIILDTHHILTFYLTFFLAYTLTFFLAFFKAICWHSFWHLFWHIWHSIWHLFWHSLWHGHCRTQWDLALAVEARQCPLRCGAHSWGPAVRNSQLRCEAAGGEGEGSNSDKI